MFPSDTPPQGPVDYAQDVHVKRWLMLGVLALALSGFYAITLVVARTPQLAGLEWFQHFFHLALVVHVDLSVLVWFLCAWLFMISAYSLPQRPTDLAQKIAQLCMFTGTALMVIAPFEMEAEPLKNNYVPMLVNSVFFSKGLMFIALATVLSALISVFFTHRPNPRNASMSDALAWAVRGASLIVLFAAAALFISWREMPDVLEGEQYYDALFWASGHLLQFVYTQILMMAWVVMFAAIYPEARLKGSVLLWIFLGNALLGALGIYGSMAYEVGSFEHHGFFTRHMILCGGIAPMLMLIYAAARFRARGSMAAHHKHLVSALVVSLLLFLYGGVLGLSIQGQDAVIPAHYHGAIIAVTIATMGFAYSAVPRYYPHAPQLRRWMYWQPVILGIGQFLHISGLAWSGGYGALRKTPGAANLSADAKIALGVMGIGGLLAIIGGLLFVVIMIRVMQKPKTTG